MLKDERKYILITGGAGFIGSHITLQFLQSDYDVIVVDNLINSSKIALQRVESIVQKKLFFIEGDITDFNLLEDIFSTYSIELVIHLASLKAIGESVKRPLEYYRNNIVGMLVLLKAMQEAKVKNIVFSSSATVYGKPENVPVTEQTSIGEATNPYAASKITIEQVLHDLYIADPTWSIAILRYFNPTGAHKSALIGEDPKGIPTNLVPFVAQVAIGKRERLYVYGGDYPTHDGTGMRDYIHVVDLAKGHLRANDHILNHPGEINVWNLGTGKGYTVLEVIKAFERVLGRKIPYEIVARRPGDIAECWADCSKANRELNWYAEKSLEQMMVDMWRWQKNNPNGFRSD